MGALNIPLIQIAYQYLYHGLRALFFFIAIENSSVETVRALLDAGADPDLIAFENVTPLKLAAEVVSSPGLLLGVPGVFSLDT